MPTLRQWKSAAVWFALVAAPAILGAVVVNAWRFAK